MKKIILLLIVTLSINYSNAQTGNSPDSIKQLLLKEKTDTGRVMRMTDLAFELHTLKPDTAMTLSLQALELSRRIHFEKGEAASLNRIGLVYHVTGNYTRALDYFLQALKINERINNPDGLQRNYSNIGLSHITQGNFKQALMYFYKAKPLAEEANGMMRFIVLDNISNCYLYQNLIDSAAAFANEESELAIRMNNPLWIGKSFYRLATISFARGQYKLAREYGLLSVPYIEKAGDYAFLNFVNLSSTVLFRKLGQQDSVLYYGRQGYLWAKKSGLHLQVLTAATILSSYYRKINADSALFYIDIAKAISDSINTREKQQQFQLLAFDEKMRQQEIAAAKLKAKDERKHNLQYAAIAIALITFVILFLLLSRSIIVKTKFIEFFGVLGLLAVFEFVNLFIHPYLSHATNDSPVLMLVVLIAIGALLIPLHHKLEKWITKIMVEKNKKIRLEAAKKTIAKLKGENS